MSEPGRKAPAGAAATTGSVVIGATPAAVMDVIADLGSYPEWVPHVKAVEVLARGQRGRAETARFVLDAGVLNDDYTLAYTWSDDEVSWQLVRGRSITAMDGSYRLRAVDGGTEVEYRLTVGVALPVIAALRRRAERIIVDTALHGLKRRMET